MRSTGAVREEGGAASPAAPVAASTLPVQLGPLTPQSEGWKTITLCSLILGSFQERRFATGFSACLVVHTRTFTEDKIYTIMYITHTPSHPVHNRLPVEVPSHCSQSTMTLLTVTTGHCLNDLLRVAIRGRPQWGFQAWSSNKWEVFYPVSRLAHVTVYNKLPNSISQVIILF